MKNATVFPLFMFFAFLCLQNCQKECCENGNPITPTPRFVDGRGTATIQGTINCIDGRPKAGVEVIIQDSSGSQWTQLTDSLGKFELAQMPNIRYAIQFSYADNDTTAYSPDEVDSIVVQMTDFLTNFNNPEFIALLLYDVNASGSITPKDIIDFRIAYQSHQYNLPWQWRFVALDESSQISSNAISYPPNEIVQMLQPNATVELEYIAVRTGDRYGYACNN